MFISCVRGQSILVYSVIFMGESERMVREFRVWGEREREINFNILRIEIVILFIYVYFVVLYW